jgi:MFS family permease
MTNLSASPLIIAFLAFSNSFPLMVLSIPAGLMADHRDRRKILLFAQVLMFVAALCLGIKVWQGNLTETLLLSLSFIMGVGNALNGPAFQTVISDLVPHEEQQNAVLVFYMGINAARVLGPAIGGGILGSFGASTAFWVNAVSFLGLIVFFFRWPLPEKTLQQEIPPTAPSWSEEFKILFSLHNIKLWIEILGVTFCASCLWALYPTKGRVELHLDSFRYGSLLGCLGLGACVSAVFSKKLMGGATAKSLSVSYMFYSLGLLCLGWGDSYIWMCLGMFLAGVGWIVLATLMNMSSRQLTGKSHLKATMLGVFLAVFYTGMSLGSVVWGAVARLEGLAGAFVPAALFLALIGLYKSAESYRAPMKA